MSVTLNIRAKEQQRDLIDQAAERLGRNRSEFMLEASCREAERVLLDQTFFALQPDKFAEFQTLLEQDPEENLEVRRVLARKPCWLRES